MTRSITCIACPLGCALTAEYSEGSETVAVSGNKCAKGEVYATEEILAPKRTVTATVSLLNGELSRLPVRTNSALVKGLIPELLKELYGIEMAAPIASGDRVISNFKGTGIDVIATRSCEKNKALLTEEDK